MARGLLDTRNHVNRSTAIMSLSLDKALGIHPTAMLLRSRRLELLASNLANADTPNYKSRDIDFRDVLTTAAGQGQRLALRRTREGHLATPGINPQSPELLYRVPSQPALDGNTVDPQLERANFAENAMQYQASLEFLNRRVTSIKSAFKRE